MQNAFGFIDNYANLPIEAKHNATPVKFTSWKNKVKPHDFYEQHHISTRKKGSKGKILVNNQDARVRVPRDGSGLRSF